ncbi:hypothetical protein ACWOBT_06465, partial [Gemella cuniculi]
MKYKNISKKLYSTFLAFSLIFTMFNGYIQPINTAKAESTGTEGKVTNITSKDANVQIHQNGCELNIKTTQETNWKLPRKPIDLVILQDASGSFQNTISGVKEALKTLTTPVEANKYDSETPRLVFTDNQETSDRVMVASFQGLDGYRIYDDYETTYYRYGNTYYSRNIYKSDSNFTGDSQYGVWENSTKFKVESTGLVSNSRDIHNFIDNIVVGGGTPTVPAIKKVIQDYKNKVTVSQAQMKNERKTVFLVITDGVANGVMDDNGNVVIQYSGWRNSILRTQWNLSTTTEASQNITARAKELSEVGKDLQEAVGKNGSVVVGFWEDVVGLSRENQYYTAYKEGFSGTSVNIGDDHSVQDIFSSALKSIASPDKMVNGKKATFYVNEQNNIDEFANKVLSAVGNALVKENVNGEFTVTEGYRVKSVTINEKQVVEDLTDSKTQIRGKVSQEGNKVTISVPEAAFNPGKNKFDYELVRTEEAPELKEEDEQTPPDDYVPGKEQREVGQLVGRFKVGDYQTDEIGSKDTEKVEVNSLKYCYPNVKKSITDTDASNDKGEIQDPILPKRQSYAANLGEVQEEFSYKVDYRMNNIPLNMEKNAMLVDPINYRLEVLDAYVTDTLTGEKLTNFEIRKVKDTDPQTNKERTIV